MECIPAEHAPHHHRNSTGADHTVFFTPEGAAVCFGSLPLLAARSAEHLPLCHHSIFLAPEGAAACLGSLPLLAAGSAEHLPLRHHSVFFAPEGAAACLGSLPLLAARAASACPARLLGGGGLPRSSAM